MKKSGDFASDLPIQTPPPMADLAMTSRLRLAPSLSISEFGRSPLLSRTTAFGTNFSTRKNHPTTTFTASRFMTLEDVRVNIDVVPPHGSKYLKDNDLARELEEVKNLSYELQTKFPETLNASSSNIYFNEHYISDIDENEELAEFSHRRYSDSPSQCDKFFVPEYKTLQTRLKVHKSMRMPSPILVKRHDSLSSFKSSEWGGGSGGYGGASPLSAIGKKLEFELAPTPKVLRSPCRAVVKIANVR